MRRCMEVNGTVSGSGPACSLAGQPPPDEPHLGVSETAYSLHMHGLPKGHLGDAHRRRPSRRALPCAQGPAQRQVSSAGQNWSLPCKLMQAGAHLERTASDP